MVDGFPRRGMPISPDVSNEFQGAFHGVGLFVARSVPHSRIVVKINVDKFCPLWFHAPRMTDTIPCPRCNGRGRILDPVGFGRRMRKARERAGWTAVKLAKSVGCSVALLYRMERGQRTWTFKRMSAIRKLLKTKRSQ